MAAATEPLESIEDMWLDVAKRFQARTEKSVLLNPPKTLKECIQKIEETRAPTDVEGSSKREKAKAYGIGVLQCIKLLGGVAAQGGEMIFGAPSTLCFNALFLLLDIPEKIKGFRDQVDGLFAILEPSLSNFRIYENIDQFGTLEPELKQTIHKVMISFVDICALSIKLRDSSRWSRFKDGVKLVLLSDDSEVKQHIADFQQLNQNHHWIQSTQILKTSTQTLGTVLEMDSNLKTFLFRESENMQKLLDGVASLNALDEKRSADDVKRKQLENIHTKLNINLAQYESLKGLSNKLIKDSVPTTATWFRELEEFNRWAERDDDSAKPLFCLTGTQNTGKSTVLSAIVNHLQSMYDAPARQSPRTLVASYFFSSTTSKGGKNDQDKTPIATGLKFMAIQLAYQHQGYAKFLSDACNSKTDVSQFFRDVTCGELWEFLAIGSPKGSAAHYLVIDGLGDLPHDTVERRAAKAELLDIISESACSTMRVLLSVREDPFQMERSPSYYHVDIAEHNKADIVAYIRHDMQYRNIFQDEEDEALRAKILETLSSRVAGNFNKAKVALDQVREVEEQDGLESDIDKILNESSMDEKQISETILSQLKERLTGSEIDELNELLAWVVCGRRLFRVEELSAALVLKFNRKGTLRLAKKLQGKYSNVLSITTYGWVVLVDNLRDLIIKRRDKPRSDDDTPTFSATITINKGDIRTVQSFLWSLSQKLDSAQNGSFGFQPVIDQRLSKSDIQVNEVDGCLTILRRTFSVMAGEHGDLQEEADSLTMPLLGYLPDHLKMLEQKAVGFDGLTPSQKQEIGSGLFPLFASDKIIERNWKNCAYVNWIRDAEEVEVFREWLAKPEVTSHLGMLDREWLNEVEASQNPNQKLLSNIMRAVVRHGLCERSWDAGTAFDWLRGYMSLPSGQANEVDADKDGSASNEQNRDEELDMESIVQWCIDQFSITKEKTAFMYERIGEAYKSERDWTSAIDAYKKAIDYGNHDFECLLGLAESLAMNQSYGEACERMTEALKLLDEDGDSDSERRLTSYRNLGRWSVHFGQIRRGVEYMKQAVAIKPDDQDIYYENLLSLLDCNLLEEVSGLIKDVVEAAKSENETSLLERVLALIVEDSDRVTTSLPKLCKAIANQKDIFAAVVESMPRVTENAGNDDKGLFLFCEGIVSYYHSTMEGVPPESALQSWKKCFATDPSTPWHRYAFMWTCAYHCDQAKALRSSDPEGADSHIRQLHQITLSEGSFRKFGSNTYLAAYYAKIEGDVAKSRSILKRTFDTAVGLLTDDNDGNDWDGYYKLSNALRSSDDDVGAVQAFFLSSTSQIMRNDMARLLELANPRAQALSAELIETLPNEGMMECQLPDQLELMLKGTADAAARASAGGEGSAEEETQAACKEIEAQIREIQEAGEPVCSDFNCDGLCGKRWDFTNPFNICKYCENNGFCDDCLKKLKEDGLTNLVFSTRCSKDHEWLRLESWTRKAYLDALRRKVPVNDGVVDAKEWLDGLKKSWGCVN